MLLLLLFRLSIVTLVANAEETFIPVLDFSYDLVSDAGSHASLDLEALADDIPPSFTVCIPSRMIAPLCLFSGAFRNALHFVPRTFI